MEITPAPSEQTHKYVCITIMSRTGFDAVPYCGVYACVCVCMRMYVCVCIHMYICMYVYMHTVPEKQNPVLLANYPV